MSFAGEPKLTPRKCKWNGFTDLGVGIGLRVPHYQHILSEKPVVPWFEIISENYLKPVGRSAAVLERICDQYIVIQHGVALYPGSTDDIDWDYLRQIRDLVKRTGTPYLSDHLCWGSVDGRYTHDLMPLPYTLEVAKWTAERLRIVQDFLEVPVCVENVSSYVTYRNSGLTEWEFLSEVVGRADCGILLDVNNIYVSSVNHSFSPDDYLKGIPYDRVGQVHIAGHRRQGNLIIDTHDQPVIDPVWELYRAVLKITGPINTLLEWDSSIPSFDEVFAEATKANQVIAELTPLASGVAEHASAA